MAKISTIYDKIVDVLEANLSGHTRMPNPYEVNANTYLHLNNGFGVGIGPGQDTERYVGCLVTWEQSYSIILVRRVVTTQNNTTARETIEKDILADWDVLRKAFYLDNTLSGNAIKTTVVSHGGVNFIDGDRLKFLALEMQLVVEYQEDPNA
jgi:hypothetical protein